MKEIYAAFVKAQKAFAPAMKSATNPHFKSKYADLSSCIEAVMDALNANGIGLTQASHECADGVCIETLLVHESGESMSGGKFHVPAIKQDPQAYGSALTYARRYSLMATCGHAPEDDDGNAGSKPPPVAQKEEPAKPPVTAPTGLTAEVEGKKMNAAFTKVYGEYLAELVDDGPLTAKVRKSWFKRSIVADILSTNDNKLTPYKCVELTPEQMKYVANALETENKLTLEQLTELQAFEIDVFEDGQ